ncbi:hypothetical protein HDU88_007490 [Geranomyces variabilis]|nr:hypothetical protein HDU88_007490 [Geranomyces variabilis]
MPRKKTTTDGLTKSFGKIAVDVPLTEWPAPRRRRQPLPPPKEEPASSPAPAAAAEASSPPSAAAGGSASVERALDIAFGELAAAEEATPPLKEWEYPRSSTTETSNYTRPAQSASIERALDIAFEQLAAAEEATPPLKDWEYPSKFYDRDVELYAAGAKVPPGSRTFIGMAPPEDVLEGLDESL